jgi:hypothetical protein
MHLPLWLWTTGALHQLGLADRSARQAVSSTSIGLLTSCSNQHDSGHCFVPQALQSIDLHPVTLLPASCCWEINGNVSCKKNVW